MIANTSNNALEYLGTLSGLSFSKNSEYSNFDWNRYPWSTWINSNDSSCQSCFISSSNILIVERSIFLSNIFWILDKFNKLTAYGKHASGNNVIFSYDGKQVANSDSEVIFNFDDFGDTKNIKKLYKVIVTYSSQDQASDDPIKEPFSYNYINESGTLATGTLTGDVSDSNGVQTVDNFLFNANGSPLKAQALQLKYIPNQVGDSGGGTETSKWEINDITVVYRTLGKVVT